MTFHHCMLSKSTRVIFQSCDWIAFICHCRMCGRDGIFWDHPSSCPCVCCLSVNNYLTSCDIGLSCGRISVKPDTNIHHVSGHCWKGCQGQRSRSWPDHLTVFLMPYLFTQWKLNTSCEYVLLRRFSRSWIKVQRHTVTTSSLLYRVFHKKTTPLIYYYIFAKLWTIFIKIIQFVR